MNWYNEPLRPQIHFTAKYGWINDPNGLIYIDGVYHMFFQHEPTGIEPKKMHWGHAVSTDLVHWKEIDIALYPDKRGAMWSGSAILDKNNLLGKNTPDSAAALLFYTTTDPFVQNISYSTDGFKTIHEYEGNPVLEHIMYNNRDPKVIFCNELNCYIMALYLKSHKYAIFCSENLVDWKELQRFETDDSECPDIFPLTDKSGKNKWIFIGASNKYIVGDFKDGKFTPCQQQKSLHFGSSAYAGQTFSNMPNDRCVRIVWNNNWNFDTKTFCGQMGIAVELSLDEHGGEYYLQAKPVKELEKLFLDSVSHKEIFNNFESQLDKAPYHFNFQVKNVEEGESTISIFGIDISIDFTKSEISVSDCTAPICIKSDFFELSVIIDRCSIELFADNVYISCLVLSDYNKPWLRLKTENAMDLEMNKLDSIWNKGQCYE